MTTATTRGATKPEVLDTLNVDLSKEHGAILQYVMHAAQMRGSGAQNSIMEAAREEMWHFEWLVEAIRARGGTPTLRRQKVILDDGLVVSLEADKAAEDDALDHYQQTLDTIGDGDEALSRLIERIMDDERTHRVTFTRLAEWVGSTGEPAFKPQPQIGQKDAAVASPMIGLEYEGLLQYLWNKYGSGDKEASELHFELAINEMRHLMWIATCYGGYKVGQPPRVPADEIEPVATSAAALARANAYEGHAQRVIADVRGGVKEEAISSEMRRIEFQHGWHRYQLADGENQPD